MSRLEEAQRLALEGEPEEALVICRRLIEEGEPEALALAAALIGRAEGAQAELVELAEGFVAAHPGIARGWEVLGDVRSRGGELEAAEAAYARAEAAGADPSRLACARASAWIQAGRHEAARAALDAVGSDSPYLVRAAMLRLQSCNQTGEPEAGLGWVERTLHGKPLTAPPPELAWLMVEEGHARLATGDREQALRCAVRAAALDRGNPGALFVLREAMNLRSRESLHYRVQLEGELLEEAGGGRFTAAYELVAESPSEALALCRPLEPGAGELSIVAFEKGEPAPELPKGVYRRTARSALQGGGA